jgi:thioester reductase-like protein
VEGICASASKIQGMEGRVNVVRVGQLTGDTKNGIWNMNEAWPLMLSTVKELKCLPSIKQKLDWLPLDVAAQAIADISLKAGARNRQDEMVYHVVNHAPKKSWSDLLEWIGRVSPEEFQIVEPIVWLKKLEEMEDHPAKKLRWLWEKALGNSKGGNRSLEVEFRAKRTVELSKAMTEFEVVDEALLQKIRAWLEGEISTRRESY